MKTLPYICRTAVLAAAAALAAAGCAQPEQRVYPRRWFYVNNDLRSDTALGQMKDLVERASAAGFNGMVLSGGLDRMDLADSAWHYRLSVTDSLCRARGVGIIPCVFSVGYAHSLLAHNRNLAAGLPVTDRRFAVTGSTAVPVADPAVFINNGGFERTEGKRIGGYWLQDRPGRVSFIDTVIRHTGKRSIRFQNFHKSYKGHGRIMQELEVQPHRGYLVTCWVKTSGLKPAGAFRILALKRDRSDLAPRRFRVPSTTGWTKVELPFNSQGQRKVRIYAGTWGATAGTLWIDDLRVRETGLQNVLRRGGTPLTIKTADGRLLREGTDFRPVRDTVLDFTYDRPSPVIRLLPAAGCTDADTLSVTFFHALPVRYRQMPVCMSETEPYAVWERNARLIQAALRPEAWFLDMDEVRAGGGCRACTDRNISMARILGDCVTRQRNIIRSVNPHAAVFVWSDMFDPAHNAADGYYLVQGDLTGSWRYIPEDVGIMCWNYPERKKSLKHFDKNGFTMMAAQNVDRTGDISITERWLNTLDRYPSAEGFMYVTWDGDYGSLSGVGRILMQRGR